MHYLTLVTVEIPKTEAEPEIDKSIQDKINMLETSKTAEHDFMTSYSLKRLRALSNVFGRRVDQAIEKRLDPYGEQTENPYYLEFEDHTEELRKEYENETVDCIKLPDGRIVSVENRIVWDKFIIGNDGLVYQKYFGPLKHMKRSKKAKKMMAIKSYPYTRLYKTFNDFAEQERCFDYDEEHQGYGYVYNPNAFYDWYSVGGRWPFVFLVKDTCEEYSIGELSWMIQDETPPAPEGYRWVCAARKKDIQWQVMFAYQKESAVKRFRILEQAFTEKKMPEGEYGCFTDDGIPGFGAMLYIKDETVQQYLARKRVVRKYKYPSFAHSYLDSNGEYYSKDYIYEDDYNKRERIWHKCFNRFIASLDDETVLVSVDCHI